MKQVEKILDSINDNVCKYKECKRIQTELKAIGYNCDYGLSGEIYDIVKIE